MWLGWYNCDISKEVGNMMTTKELAKYLQVHENTIGRYVKKGMPCVKLEKAIRFDLDDVLRWIKEQSEKEKKGE